MRKSRKKTRELRVRLDLSSKDAGLSTLLSDRVIEWIEKNSRKGDNLIQTCASFRVDKPTVMCLRAISHKSWGKKIPWVKILCRTYTKDVKGTPCKIGKARKMFIKLRGERDYAGFGVYIKYLQKLPRAQAKNFHKKVVKQLDKIFGNKKIYLHGEDVDWFHVKANKKKRSTEDQSKK